MPANEEHMMEKIVPLAKRRGFIFPGSDVYGGLAGVYDYGPLGSLLKENIKQSWLDRFVHQRTDMHLLDSAILMNEKVWEASGHLEGFNDPLVECRECKRRFRADQLEENACPECDGALGEERQFNMMFKTHAGATEEGGTNAYLRPETAQGIFVNYKNVMDTMQPKVPFGIAQIGKAFRNEITPRDFLFRIREMEQLEIEYFVHPDNWADYFSRWKSEMLEWMEEIGLSMNFVHEIEIPEDELAHYSKRTIDFEFEYPFGQKELYGLAYRTDYDLGQHAKYSGEKMQYTDPYSEETYIPHVVEPSFGMDRTILALLLSAYREDTLEEGGDTRIFLKLPPHIAPHKVMVSPLLKNKEQLVDKAGEVFKDLKQTFGNVVWDDNGNIGKRYRRQDEIGTPYCVTIDFDTVESDDSVTVRDRDTGDQERVAISELENYLSKKLSHHENN